MLQTFSPNLIGKDFVVGDIHARFDEFMQSLQQQGFNPEVDRLFCVGDLIDRGTQPKAVVELLQQPWFFAVRGNHEQMLLDQFEDERVIRFNYEHMTPAQLHQWAEGEWFAALSKDEQHWFFQALTTLPFMIEIHTPQGTAGLCHGGIPLEIDDWQQLKSRLAEREVREQMLRTREGMLIQRRISGIDITVHGHTTFPEIQQQHNSFWIDTFDKLGEHTVIELTKLMARGRT